MDEQSEVCWLVDRTKIIDVVVAFANAMDAKDWQKLRSHLTDDIDIDYQDFRGELPQRITAEEYVQQRADGLRSLRTLHISTNHEVAITGDRAICKSAYRIYRVDPNKASGQDRLDTAGNYIHQLIQTARCWRISGIKQTVTVISGDRQVHGFLKNEQ